MQEQKIYGRREGAVGHLVFNNPAKLNAVSLDMWDGFVGILRDYEKDPEVRCVVVSGSGGKAFVSGADISKFESERANAEAQVRYDSISKQGYESLYNFPKPTIAKITGYCIRGGMNLAACCDLRYCNEGARFGVPAAKLGLGYGFLRIERMSRIIGLPRAMEFLFTAKQYSSKEAYDMGLVHGVAADAELDAMVDGITGAIAQNAPLTIALAKASAREIAKPESRQDHKKLEKMTGQLREEDFKAAVGFLGGEKQFSAAGSAAGSAPRRRAVFQQMRHGVARPSKEETPDHPPLPQTPSSPHGASRRADLRCGRRPVSSIEPNKGEKTDAMAAPPRLRLQKHRNKKAMTLNQSKEGHAIFSEGRKADVIVENYHLIEARLKVDYDTVGQGQLAHVGGFDRRASPEAAPPPASRTAQIIQGMWAGVDRRRAGPRPMRSASRSPT
jgi:enoyl-CoA hydratase/carnithine racemase